MRLNLGCGFDLRPGYINVDFTTKNGADLAMNLEQIPWPWADEEVEEILAFFCLEHVDRFDAVWSEIHRVLRVGGRIAIGVYSGINYDPFHTRYFTRRSIQFLTNGYVGHFRLVGKPRMRRKPGGFPSWHLKHYLGLDCPSLTRPRLLEFILEKTA